VVPRLLGRYENFPQVIHGIARFICQPSTRKVQHAISRTLHELNEQVFSLEDIAAFSSSECEVGFEFGIADRLEFNYLDAEELNRLRESIFEKALSSLDFFCVVRYHTFEDGKRVPLRFDYHMLRFVFPEKNRLELRVSHERGIRHISVENLITFVTKRINEELSESRLKPLKLESLRAL
jgi:hypothetical protein